MYNSRTYYQAPSLTFGDNLVSDKRHLFTDFSMRILLLVITCHATSASPSKTTTNKNEDSNILPSRQNPHVHKQPLPEPETINLLLWLSKANLFFRQECHAKIYRKKIVAGKLFVVCNFSDRGWFIYSATVEIQIEFHYELYSFNLKSSDITWYIYARIKGIIGTRTF